MRVRNGYKAEAKGVGVMYYRKRVAMCLVAATLCLAGCGGTTVDSTSKTGELSDFQTVFVPQGVDSYDSADVAVVEHVDTDKKEIRLFNLNVAKSYTLTYDGTTVFYDKNGQSLSARQIEQGVMVDVTFLKDRKHLNSACIKKDAWIKQNVHDFELSNTGKIMKIAGEKYRITDQTKIYSNGQSVELMDINVSDSLQLVGVDHTIYSMTVTTGHGYLRLENDTAILGGYIEVGQSIIKQITEDMLLVVPEGDYQVIVSYGSESLIKQISIKRDEETSLDLSEFEPEELKYGNIFFTLEPQEATLQVDGEEVDISAPVELSYGLHQMVAQAEGYETLTKYFKVSSEYATLSLRLDEEKQSSASGNSQTKETSETSESSETAETNGTQESTAAESSTTDGSTATESTTTENATNESTAESTTGDDPSAAKESIEETSGQSGTVSPTSYRVYIDSPSGVEIYLDGNYIGLSPIDFKKESGTHTVTLRKSGYTTRSYTITLDTEEKDVSFSFSELELSQ